MLPDTNVFQTSIHSLKPLITEPSVLGIVLEVFLFLSWILFYFMFSMFIHPRPLGVN